ncbi:carbamoyltransferase HypF [Streptomyces sp. TRM 70361]|uniref:carbamoyltransferase HypF n=1 Tax=Streptomyces sp. TRM 70361 TaxID=3116553 RepID=UPI002E7BDE69|nr:carbamoyltransferase HypF [Streptomyces sp. TRM 70361]MEE1940195.1 carbamoyltransferase HypF [Streptomyces sp. TRM 70361]
MAAPGPGTVRRRVTVGGTVQGVGFRPYVHTLARELGLTGHVANTAGGVVAEVEGGADAVEAFCRRVAERPPPLAVVSSVTCETVPPLGTARPEAEFTIRPSQCGEGRTRIPPDTATCADCLRELADPADRRHRHPFITCTHCGPRFTIATALPYDRAATTMAAFPLCPACAREYADPADRRFHAQPVACHDCGPRLRLTPAGSTSGSPGTPGGPAAEGAAALAAVRRLLADGAVVAVKGLGGYHLACDATNPAAVAALRERKARGTKPLAVMCPDPGTAARLARLNAAERRVLTGRRRPIVLLRRRTDHGPGPLAPGVCDGSPDVGVLLPYTPLHRLLLGLPGDAPGPAVLVMTSGNRSGEPIVTDDREALDRLAGIADAWLWHDRPIAFPCDDSVVRVRPDGGEVVLRRSRGYVPEPVELPVPLLPALAAGGDLKNALCLGEGRTAWFAPHLGDLDDPAALRALDGAERRMRALTGVDPKVLAADRHPGYRSTRWARARAAGGPPPRLVQHHHAHIASAMAENGLDGGAPVIGVAFDGTGHGDDGAVWGGEVLLADYARHRRLAHLAYVPLPGGDAGVGNPCRMALSQLRSAGLPWDADLPCTAACPPEERRVLARQLERGLACVPTSSMGRLFDAMASLVGLCHRAGHEAQAAVALEAAAARVWADGGPGYSFALRPAPGGDGLPALLDPAPVLRAAVADLRSGTPPPVIAARFHRAVAKAVEAACRLARRRTGTTLAALTGGVFANALLDQECERRLRAAGFTVLRHHRVPPGDGGLALGQLLVAARAGSP